MAGSKDVHNLHHSRPVSRCCCAILVGTQQQRVGLHMYRSPSSAVYCRTLVGAGLFEHLLMLHSKRGILTCTVHGSLLTNVSHATYKHTTGTVCAGSPTMRGGSCIIQHKERGDEHMINGTLTERSAAERAVFVLAPRPPLLRQPSVHRSVRLETSCRPFVELLPRV